MHFIYIPLIYILMRIKYYPNVRMCIVIRAAIKIIFIILQDVDRYIHSVPITMPLFLISIILYPI